MGERNGIGFHVLEVSQTDILEIIKKMQRGKAYGPFSIPTQILKDYGQFLVDLLQCVISKSLREGIFQRYLSQQGFAQFSKKVTNKNVVIIGQYHCSLV